MRWSDRDKHPYHGVDVYDSFTYQGHSGWLVFGGTSVAAPLVASVYALAGNASSTTYGSYPYSHTSRLNDVTTGQTSTCGSDLCAAVPGWDGPTGLGTPNGIGGFSSLSAPWQRMAFPGGCHPFCMYSIHPGGRATDAPPNVDAAIVLFL